MTSSTCAMGSTSAMSSSPILPMWLEDLGQLAGHARHLVRLQVQTGEPGHVADVGFGDHDGSSDDRGRDRCRAAHRACNGTTDAGGAPPAPCRRGPRRIVLSSGCQPTTLTSGRLQAFVRLSDVELDLLALGQGTEPVADDLLVVHKELVAVVASDEPPPLFRADHLRSPWIWRSPAARPNPPVTRASRPPSGRQCPSVRSAPP